jgi:hypothetical protein
MAGVNGFPGFLTDFTRGTTKDFEIRISKNGEPIDITGAKFIIAFAQSFADEPVLRIDIDNPTDPVEGKTVGEITDTDSLSLDPGKWCYSVKYINPTGKSYVIDQGKIKLYENMIDDIE